MLVETKERECDNTLLRLMSASAKQKTLFHEKTFFARAATLWKEHPSECFPDHYSLNVFNSITVIFSTYRLKLHSLAPTVIIHTATQGPIATQDRVAIKTCIGLILIIFYMNTYGIHKALEGYMQSNAEKGATERQRD